MQRPPRRIAPVDFVPQNKISERRTLFGACLAERNRT